MRYSIKYFHSWRQLLPYKLHWYRNCSIVIKNNYKVQLLLASNFWAEGIVMMLTSHYPNTLKSTSMKTKAEESVVLNPTI